MKYYAMPGTRAVIVDESEGVCPPEYAVMRQGRPEGLYWMATESGEWVPDFAAIKDAIDGERDRRMLEGGYLVGQFWFHSDTKSRTQQVGLDRLGELMPTGLQWKTLSGDFVEMTPDLARQILQAGSLSDQAIFAVARSHEVAMRVSESPANYDFSSGWPPTYLDSLI